MSKSPSPAHASASVGTEEEYEGSGAMMNDYGRSLDCSDYIDKRSFCKQSLALLQTIPRQRIGGRSLSAADLASSVIDGSLRNISGPPPDPLGKPTKDDVFGRNCWAVFSERSIMVIDRSTSAPPSSSSTSDGTLRHPSGSQCHSKCPKTSLMIPSDELKPAIFKLFDGVRYDDLEAACTHEGVRPMSMVTWAQFRGVCWTILQTSFSKLGEHIQLKEFHAEKRKKSVMLSPIEGSQSVASLAISMGATKREADAVAALIKPHGSILPSEPSLSSIPSLRSASSAKELPTLSISGSEKASICELAKKELRRKRETKDCKFYGVEKAHYAMNTAHMIVADICDPSQRYHTKWRSVLKQRRLREEASIQKSNKQSIAEAISSTVRSCEKIGYAQVRHAAFQSEMDAKLRNYNNRRAQELQTKQSIAQWRDEAAVAKAESVRAVKDMVHRTRDYMELLQRSNALTSGKPLKSSTSAADLQFDDELSSIFGDSVGSREGNDNSSMKIEGPQRFTWSQNSTYVVDVSQDLKKSLSRDVNGMSVLDKEKLKNYVRDTVTERLRGIARERRERISLSAIDCPVSLTLMDGSEYFEEPTVSTGANCPGGIGLGGERRPSRHRNAFPANRF